MKRTNLSLKKVGFSLMILFSLFFFTGQAVAEGYLGEFCWKITYDAHNYVILKFAVLEVGVGHYTLNGSIKDYEEDILQHTNVAHGNAEIVGDKIIATLVDSYRSASSGYYAYGVYNLELDPSTLNGTLSGINTAYNSPEFNPYWDDSGEGPIEFLPNCE